MGDKPEENQNLVGQENNDAENPQAAQQEPKGDGAGEKKEGLVGSMFGDASKAFTTYASGFYGELFGTFAFGLGIIGASTSSDMQDAFVAFSLFFGILMVLPWSGGHLNPAVTAGFYCSDFTFDFAKFWVYFVAQLLGAYLGGLAGSIIVGITDAPILEKTEGHQILWAILTEAIATFTFVFIIHLAAHNSNKLNELYKVATIAFGLYFTRYIAMSSSGGALNPAIALGLQINKAILDGNNDPFVGFYVYLIGPFLGGSLAGWWFRRVYNPYFNPEQYKAECELIEKRKQEEKERKEQQKREEEEKKAAEAKKKEDEKKEQEAKKEESKPETKADE